MASKGRLACSDLGGQCPGAGRGRGPVQSGDESRRADRVKLKLTSRVFARQFQGAPYRQLRNKADIAPIGISRPVQASIRMLKATQDSLTLSRNGFQESASLLASSKYPSSKSLPTHLKYSQRNYASGNWYTCSFGTHTPNLLAEINADRIAGFRSRTLSGHPDSVLRPLMLSERLRNLEPRLRSSKAFFSSDFRLDHSNETPITIPVKKTNANLNQRRWPRARRLLKTVEAIGLEITIVAIPLESKMFSSNHLSRIGMISGISRRPQIPNRNCLSHLHIESY